MYKSLASLNTLQILNFDFFFFEFKETLQSFGLAPLHPSRFISPDCRVDYGRMAANSIA